MNTLSINQLTCGYGTQTILQDLTLSLEKEEIVCLLGASGCGKTTLLKAIAGLQPIEQGQILLAGKDLTYTELNQRQIGLIFQDYALFPHLTVAENITFGLQQKSAAEKQTILQKMTTLVRLQGLEQRYPHQLSGGQQQRVAIARALACEPKLLLLDEPFSNIDSQVRYQLIEEIRTILKQQKVPAIFVTHSKEEAFVFADKLALMDKGKIVQFGDAHTLYHAPNSRFVAEFLGNVNYLPCQIKEKQVISAFGTFDLPSAHYADQTEIKEGDNAFLLIRPEDVTIQEREQTSEQSCTDYQQACQVSICSNAVIKQRIFLGGHYRYHITLNPGCCISLDPSTNTHILVVDSHYYREEGKKVTLTFSPQQLVLFP